MKILVTGAAGFIGYHLSRRLLSAGHTVVGIDNLNDYYEPQLKLDRLTQLQALPAFSFEKLDLIEREPLLSLITDGEFAAVVNLAAQAGVRYSIDKPFVYADANLTGFLNVLEGCRHAASRPHLVYASSSSVYGANKQLPFSVHHNVDHPISLYAATKKAGELMAHTYASLYGLNCTGLRFFTVYGPWGRPDMALFKFTKAILEGRPIEVYNEGRMRRDFTYVDDIVEGLTRLIGLRPSANPDWRGENPDPGTSYAPYRVYNIGGSQPVNLMDFIETLEKALGKPADKLMRPLQPGDVVETCADAHDLEQATGFRPQIDIQTGIPRFVEWYRAYYKV